MKKLLITAFALCVFALNAQEIEPKYETQGDLIKGTYFFENGQIRQEGTYKDGKLHGKWVAFNAEGDKISEAYYQNGKKEGIWFFWNDGKLIQVEYDDSRVEEVVSWKDTSLLTKE